MKTHYQHDALAYHDPETGKYNEDLNPEGVLWVEAEYKVCPKCQGHGTHFRSDLDESRLIESMAEDGDYDAIASYRRGDYDQVCQECHGKRVVLCPVLPEWAIKELNSWYESERQDREYAAQERRMGA